MESKTTAPDPRCGGHVDMTVWKSGQPDAAGLIRVTCSVCGKFIGYRNTRDYVVVTVEPKTEPKHKGRKQNGKSTK